MIPLILGTVLATGALAFVLFPLFDERPPGRAPRTSPPADRPGAVEALREIEFDRETDKLSDDDYAALKASYTRVALEELRAVEAREAARPGRDSSGTALDAAEALVRRVRAQAAACPSCGPRPEPAALFCSACGRCLPRACDHCGALAAEPGSRVCRSCGGTLSSSAP